MLVDLWTIPLSPSGEVEGPSRSRKRPTDSAEDPFFVVHAEVTRSALGGESILRKQLAFVSLASHRWSATSKLGNVIREVVNVGSYVTGYKRRQVIHVDHKHGRPQIGAPPTLSDDTTRADSSCIPTSPAAKPAHIWQVVC